MARFAALMLVATALAGGGGSATDDVRPAKSAGVAAKPNVLVVLLDDLRWDSVEAMPTASRELAGRGVTFSNAFAVNPLCCPSRATLLTGRYSHSTRVYRNEPPFGGFASFDDSLTIETRLRRAGYRTAWIGKYLNGYTAGVRPRGWHRWVGYSGGYFRYRLSIGRERRWYGQAPGDYSTDVLARHATRFLRETRRPFFLVFAPFAPHQPGRPAPRHENAFAGEPRLRPPSFDEPDVSDKPRWLRRWPRLGPAAERRVDERRREQLASLLAVDEALARLLAELEASGRLDETVVLLTSDNGFTWGEHRLAYRKSVPYEESIRVPLVVRYDRLALPPRTEPRLVTNVDLAPTLAALAGTTMPRADGRSLLPLLRGEPTAWRDRFLIEHMRGRRGDSADYPSYCAVRTERLKYVAWATREEELYDLAADPHELANRIRDPALRAARGALRRAVKARCRPAPPGMRTSWIPSS